MCVIVVKLFLVNYCVVFGYELFNNLCYVINKDFRDNKDCEIFRLVNFIG